MSMTQQEVNEAYKETLKAWDKMKVEFKGPLFMFKLSKEAIQFLGSFEVIREQVIELGLEIGHIDPTVKVTIRDDDDA